MFVALRRHLFVVDIEYIIITWGFLHRGRIACNAERCISHDNSIHPSICLSVTRWCTQTNEDRIMGCSLWGRKNSLVFWYQQQLGATSLPPKIYAKWPTPSEKRRLRPISAYNVSTVRASEKVKLSWIWSRIHAFQRAIEEVRMLRLSLPKGGSKLNLLFLWIKINLNRINCRWK